MFPDSFIIPMEDETVAHLWATSRRDRCGMHTLTKCGMTFHNPFDDLDEYERVNDQRGRPLCNACEAARHTITPRPNLPYKHGEIVDRARAAGWEPEV